MPVDCRVGDFLRKSLLALLSLGAALNVSGAHAAVSESLIDAVEWRLIGPYRGGRVTTVTGVEGMPNLYYMGATGGGVWKTENAGTTWTNISDGYFEVGTIGAVAVARSDRNVLYVGTGESPIRGVTTSHGNGVYKSTDAGKTWTHVGLDTAGQISRIEVHPTNPDVAYVAVQGKIWAPSEERGVYRTVDGGKSWEQVLKVNSDTGASDLSMDPSNPRILYAAMWHHGRKPWFIKSGGEGGGIYKSADAGDSWTKLDGGLPDLVGKIGVDVSRSNPQRVYAIIEAEPELGGLYRSDDAGETWELINNHRVLHSRAWYYIHIKADPVDADTVWVMNVPLMKSIDGGKSWVKVDGPHSDHHDLWINPEDNRNIVNGNDGGATVTFDAGDTWSTLNNQPTAQFYRVTTDNQFPFRIYGGQQDNTTVAIASRSFQDGIGRDDYFYVGGGESAHIALDPDDPRRIYATTINGTLTEYDTETEVRRSIIPYPEMVYGKDSKDLKYRANWNAPVAMSPHDSSVVYFGTQMLLQSDDRGSTWTEISPDLTRDDESRQGRNGGPLTPENVGAEFYHTIFYVVESPHEPGTIWVGSDDGLVHLTTNGGESWTNVSPPHRGEAMINAIEISPHDAGTAYLAVTGFKLDDFRPYIYKTTDYGKRWKRVDGGLPKDTFVRVVREDPKRQGLLYAGTEAGMFVSYNDGDDWQSMQFNLPGVPITDLSIRQDTLVAATQGRGFWVIDDLFVVRQASAGLAEKALHVYTPDKSYLMSGGGSAEGFEADNPSTDVPIYYFLGDESGGPFSIEILDADGRVIRTYSDEESDHDRCRIGNMDPRRPFEIEYPETSGGLNRWDWDLRSYSVHCIDDIALYGGFDGPRVAPGSYSVRVRAGAVAETVSFDIELDPRLTAGDADIETWVARLNEVKAMLNASLHGLEDLRRSRSDIELLMAEFPDDEELQVMGVAANAAIGEWEQKITQLKHQTYEDEDAWETMLAGQLRYLFNVIDRTGPPVTQGAIRRMRDLSAEWSTRRAELNSIANERIRPINEWARANDVTHVKLPR